jgi:CheY-like chemotaxis protein
MTRVLVVEDDAAIVGVIGETLGADVRALRICGDGALVSQMVAEQPVDLLMLDVDVNGCDAFDVCRVVRERDSAEHRTAVIVMTHAHDLATRLMAFCAGADDWLSKPLDAHDVRARFARWAGPPAAGPDVEARRRQAIDEALGVLCHQVNNPLAAASMGVELALRRGKLPAESARELGVARDNLDRISAILLGVQQRRRGRQEE